LADAGDGGNKLCNPDHDHGLALRAGADQWNSVVMIVLNPWRQDDQRLRWPTGENL